MGLAAPVEGFGEYRPACGVAGIRTFRAARVSQIVAWAVDTAGPGDGLVEIQRAVRTIAAIDIVVLVRNPVIVWIRVQRDDPVKAIALVVGIAAGWKRALLLPVELVGQKYPPLVGSARNLSGEFLRLFEGRQENGDQQRNDRDDYEQFDQRETM